MIQGNASPGAPDTPQPRGETELQVLGTAGMSTKKHFY